MLETSHRMSRVDTAWLRMDNDVNLMMIVGVWLLQPGITHAALCGRIQDKLLKYERFRQRVELDTLGASWVHDESFDLQRHVPHGKLQREPGQSEREALQALVDESQKFVTGTVRLKLYKGNIITCGRKSKYSMYDDKIASMEGVKSWYNQSDATGFIRLNGLRLRARNLSQGGPKL